MKPNDHTNIDQLTSLDHGVSSARGSAANVDTIFSWLEEVLDPEIPVLSVVDLGIVRKIEWQESDELLVVITPTYSGCPAMEVIEREIGQQLTKHGITKVVIKTQLAPAWTTRWLSEKGRKNLREFGIAPPAERSGIQGPACKCQTNDSITIACPRCGSERTALKSQFGSTPCKAFYVCLDCLEPFDYFKCH